jgi:hypothetical protein
MPAETWNALRSRAAELLEQSGQVLEAFELHRARGAVDQQIRIIIGHAPVLLGGGQHQTLLALLASLPAGCTRQVSWLELWSGIALMSADLQESRVQLERAFIAFGREGNLGGQMLAWSSVVDTWLYAMDDYHSMDSWIEWLDQHQDAFERVEDPTLREAVAVSMTWAIMHRQPDHPHILKWVKETERILGEGFHPQIRLRAGTVAHVLPFPIG